MRVRWTKEAMLRLQGVEEYIANDNPDAAVDFVDQLITAGEGIKDNPEQGRVVPELSIETIREVIHKNYRIVYAIKKSSIDILTVFEAHRQLRSSELFGE